MAKDTNIPKPEPAAHSVLEAHVHDMMDVEARPATVVMPDTVSSDESSPPPLNIFNEAAPGAPLIVAKESKPDSTVEDLITEPALPLDSEPLPEITVPPSAIDTPQSDAAIDDIVAQEADEVLAAEDAGVAAAELDAQEQQSEPAKHGHPIFWFFVLLLVIIAILTSVVLVRPDLVPFSV